MFSLQCYSLVLIREYVLCLHLDCYGAAEQKRNACLLCSYLCFFSNGHHCVQTSLKFSNLLFQFFAGSVSQAEDVNWWGHTFGFVSGGFLGATSRKRKSSRKDPANVRQTFAEEDQENLYNLVQVGMMC